MVELRVPEIVEDPFREHYRALIVGSVERATEAENARRRARGHRPPARSIVPELRFGSRMKRAAALIWFATLGALVADIVFLGVDSYATAAADLGLVAMTLVWFFACFDDLFGPGGSEQVGEQVGERGRSPAPPESPTARRPGSGDLVVRS